MMRARRSSFDTGNTRRARPLTAAALLLAAAIAMVALRSSCALALPGPGPGEPFGGDDAGCVPSRSDLRHCSDTAAGAYSRLEASLNKCHVRQVAARYAQAVLGSPRTFDEEACEAAAAARFDATLAKLEASGNCGASALLTSAPATGAALQDALDARGADLYCDASSGAAIDPSGDDAGTVPASRDALNCTKRIAGGLGKLASRVARCHRQATAAGFTRSDPPFDEEACEQRALGVFDDASTRLLASGNCPACLDATAIAALRDDLMQRLDADNGALYPCPDAVLHPRTPLLDRPTLMALGVQLPISGDENRNATVTVRYRVIDSLPWKDALPLMRVMPETIPAGEGKAVPEQFAGSIFDLRPATIYELELHAVDVDGPVDQTLMLQATTRAVPADPVTPHPVAVTNADELAVALAAAAPGDVITLADGLYAGAFVLEADGTATDPIVIRGTSRDATILDGNDCLCNVLEVYGSYVHVENLTLRNAQRALRFQTGGAIGNVVRRVHTIDTRLGFGTRDTQYDFYFCDNVLEGRLAWPNVYTDNDGLNANDDGILVQGHGQVVCHNQLVGFGDAMKTELVGARSVDFYGNEVLSAYDNGLELDVSEGNVRAWRNRFTNTFATISFQPVYGGPAYALRNVVVNVADEQMKFHGLGESAGPSGVLVYNNTFVSPGIALQVHTYAASHNFEISNNLFVGPGVLAGTRTVEWSAPIVGGTFDANGYYPDGGFSFEIPPAGTVNYASFAAMQAAGMETRGSLLAEPIFASGLAAPASYTETLAAPDVTLDAASNAVDAGVVIPGVTSGYQGSAPDLGALERGCPTPIFGVRPPGVDESNEPLGCE